MSILRTGALVIGVTLSLAPWAQEVSMAAIAKLPCDQATQRLRAGLEAGNAEAMRTTGILVETGICFAPSPRSAAAFYQRAADAGDRIARERLALLFAAGTGVDQDYASAGALLRDPPGRAGDRATPDDYPRGYAYLLSSVAAGELSRRGLSRASSDVIAFRTLPFSFEPSDPARTVSIRSLDVPNPRSRRELQQVLADVLEVATTRVPRPDVSRLTSQRFNVFFVNTLDVNGEDVVIASTAALP